jgi:hypothetical protein
MVEVIVIGSRKTEIGGNDWPTWGLVRIWNDIATINEEPVRRLIFGVPNAVASAFRDGPAVHCRKECNDM